MWHSDTLGSFTRPISFIFNNLKYGPSAFRIPEVLANATIFPMRVEPIDNRYYVQGDESRTFSDGEWVVSFESIEKSVDELKSELSSETLRWHNSTLASTDSFILREPEISEYMVNKAVNPALKVWRAEVYIATESRLIAIESASTHKELMDIGPLPELDGQPVGLVAD